MGDALGMTVVKPLTPPYAQTRTHVHAYRPFPLSSFPLIGQEHVFVCSCVTTNCARTPIETPEITVNLRCSFNKRINVTYLILFVETNAEIQILLQLLKEPYSLGSTLTKAD